MRAESTILSADSPFTDAYGSDLSLSLDGRWAIVGAPGELFPDAGGQDHGAAYLYDLAAGGAGSATKLAPLPLLPGGFGAATAISGDGALLAIGLPGDTFGDVPGVFDPSVLQGAGSVKLYRNETGTTTLLADLFMETPGALEGFGREVALSADGSRLFVTVSDLDDPGFADSRKVLVYDVTGGVPALAATLRPALNPSTVRGTEFGEAVAASADGTVLAVAAPSESGAIDPATGAPAPNRGAVYLWDLSGPAPALLHHVRLPPEVQSLRFGAEIALSADGSTLAVSGPRLDDPGGTFRGKVYVYDVAGSTPLLRHSFEAPDTGPQDVFGASLALSADGGRLVVGAVGWDGEDHDPNLRTGGFNVGQAYVFDIAGTDPVLTETLRASDEDRLDGLGATTAISGDGTRAIVAAGNGDGTAEGSGGAIYIDRGSVYTFDLGGTPPPPPQDITVRLSFQGDVYTAPADDNYTVFARYGNDRVTTGAGDDTVHAARGFDRVSTGEGADSLFGGRGRDRLDGGPGADKLYGGHHRDVLIGGADDDLLHGGARADILIGGTGQDLFVYTAAWQSSRFYTDRIEDFEQGDDLIDLSGMDAQVGVAGRQGAVFIGEAAFSGTAGELRVLQDEGAGRTLVEADVTGDGIANLRIALTGVHALAESDFLV